MLTQKDFYTTIINTTDNAEVKATAQHYLDKVLKETSAKALASATKRAETSAPKIALIESYLCSVGNEPKLLSIIAEQTGLTVQSISGLATQAEKRGHWVKYDAKVKGKGTMRAIALSTARYAVLNPTEDGEDGIDDAEVGERDSVADATV